MTSQELQEKINKLTQPGNVVCAIGEYWIVKRVRADYKLLLLESCHYNCIAWVSYRKYYPEIEKRLYDISHEGPGVHTNLQLMANKIKAETECPECNCRGHLKQSTPWKHHPSCSQRPTNVKANP